MLRTEVSEEVSVGVGVGVRVGPVEFKFISTQLMAFLDCNICHTFISLSLYLHSCDYTECSSFMSFSMEHKHGLPLASYQGTSMYLSISHTTNFPEGRHFKLKRSTLHRRTDQPPLTSSVPLDPSS